ncbi:hypothetical protein BaRGS_00028182 [Batillaria attramentaria]|uniref:Uncharacterized protein n=1 Tax=Batillaria attramentaria TaxID=370345 RepID=A0ABD0JZS5_9CAEN
MFSYLKRSNKERTLNPCSVYSVGNTQTDTREQMVQLMGFEKSAEAKKAEDQRNLKLQPLGGECSMEDVAKVVTFLASSMAAAVTGVSLPVDRGSLITPPNFDLPPGFANAGDVTAQPTQARFEMMSAAAAAAAAKGAQGPPKK